jgi:regulator of sirC expression with transglutaminase-like and TPR domain
MISMQELKAMISLLDDPDERIATSVENRLMQEGDSVVKPMEDIWFSNEFPHLAIEIESLLKKINQHEILSQFRNWWNSPQPDLLMGWFILSRTKYPGLQLQELKNRINEIKLDCWYRLGNVHRKMDQIQIINHVLFEHHRFKGNADDYHAPDNSFLNSVLDTKNGNPISLSVLYILICQSLGLPVLGVNLPQHFVVALCQQPENSVSCPLDGSWLDPAMADPVVYINPYNRGQLFTKDNIDSFLKVIGIQSQPEFYKPCANLDILKRMLRNLHYSYSKSGFESEKIFIEQLMEIGGMGDEIPEN